MFEDLLTELMGLSNDELDTRIRSNELQRRRLDAELAAAITIADHRQLPAVDDHRSINAYLRATINCSSTEASRWRSLARGVDHIDGLGEHWISGRFGLSQATQFANLYANRRVRDRLPQFAVLLLGHTEQLPYSEFTVCVDRFITRADPDGAHDHRDDAIQHRDAHVSDVAGMVDITAHGGHGVSTGELIAIFERFNQAEYDTDIRTRRDEYGDTADQHPLPRTAPQRRFDAITTIFHTAAAATGVGSITDPLVNILIDASSWTNLLTAAGLTPNTNNPNTDNPNVGGLQVADRDLLAELLGSPVPLSQRRCETSTGIQLHPHDVLRAALAGHVRRVVVDSAGVVIDMGRRQRLFTGAAREAAMLLVLRCDHPGCELPADWCDVDHAVEWANGGTTDQTNSGIECNTHNTTKTKRQWRTKRADNNRRYTIRPDGSIMLPVGVRPPTFPDDPDDADDADDDANHHDRINDINHIDDIEELERIALVRLAAHSAA